MQALLQRGHLQEKPSSHPNTSGLNVTSLFNPLKLQPDEFFSSQELSTIFVSISVFTYSIILGVLMDEVGKGLAKRIILFPLWVYVIIATVFVQSRGSKMCPIEHTGVKLLHESDEAVILCSDMT